LCRTGNPACPAPPPSILADRSVRDTKRLQFVTQESFTAANFWPGARVWQSVGVSMKSSSLLQRIVAVLLAAVACLLVLSYHPSKLHAQSAGAFVSQDASAKDVGLPLYPGSKPAVDKKSDSQSANMGLWLGGTGFQLVVVKMQTPDSPEKVAAYYRKALAKYGTVLDCTNPPSQANEKHTPNALSCDNDKTDAGGMLFKAGTKEVQHLVSVDHDGAGTIYSLVYLVAKGKGHEAEL
jgi:hypothetical protein